MLQSKRKIDGLPSGLVLPKRLCPRLVKRLQSYRWAETNKKDGSTGPRELVFKKHDDLPDALRYGVMTWPELPKGDPQAIGSRPRTFAGMPDNVRLEIERMRRCEDIERRNGDEAKASDTYDHQHYVDDGEAAIGDFNM
jgi:hypothetical protein